MAEGIRIVAKPGTPYYGGTGVICLTDHMRPIGPPKDGRRLEDVKERCRVCGEYHFAKTYQIRLYSGSAIVSHTVWTKLQRVDTNPFEYANPVPDPPAQGIGINADGRTSYELIEKFVMPLSPPTPLNK